MGKLKLCLIQVKMKSSHPVSNPELCNLWLPSPEFDLALNIKPLHELFNAGRIPKGLKGSEINSTGSFNFIFLVALFWKCILNIIQLSWTWVELLNPFPLYPASAS